MYYRIYECGCEHENIQHAKYKPKFNNYFCARHDKPQLSVRFVCDVCKKEESLINLSRGARFRYCPDCAKEVRASRGKANRMGMSTAKCDELRPIPKGAITRSDCQHRLKCLCNKDNARSKTNYLDCTGCSLYLRDPALSIEAFSGYFSGAGMTEAASSFNIPGDGRL